MLCSAIALTMDLRKAVSTLVMETALRAEGQGEPFILTKNWRELPKESWGSWILRVLRPR